MLYALLFLFSLVYVMANIVPANILARLRALAPGGIAPGNISPAQGQSQGQTQPQDQPNHIGTYNQDGTYDPSPIDVVVVRIMLARAKRVPPDLVDAIFETAQYWVRTTTAIDYNSAVGRYMSVRAGQPKDENEFMLRTLPVGLTRAHGGDLDLTGEPARPLPLQEELEPKSLARVPDYPTPRLLSPVRRIVFKILAHDQGWGGEGGESEYDNSWTWFEAGLERFEAGATAGQNGEATALSYDALRPIHPTIQPIEPSEEQRRTAETEGFNEFVHHLRRNTGKDSGASSQATTPAAAPEPETNPMGFEYKHNLLPNAEWVVHRNKRANREWQQHIVVWSCEDDVKAESDGGKALAENGRGRGTGDGEFVRSLKLGDVVTLWAKARFGGWSNSVKSASIDVYWAV